MPPTGVDFDARCKKYRARLTRRGRVYHLGYFLNREDALAARKEAEDRYANGERFDYLHSYATSTTPIEIEGDPYLYFLSSGSSLDSANPEVSLRLAVMIQAVKDYLTDRTPSAQRQAIEWFESREEDETGYSFHDLCSILQFDPDEIREAMKRASKNKRAALKMLGRRLVRGQTQEG